MQTQPFLPSVRQRSLSERLPAVEAVCPSACLWLRGSPACLCCLKAGLALFGWVCAAFLPVLSQSMCMKGKALESPSEVCPFVLLKAKSPKQTPLGDGGKEHHNSQSLLLPIVQVSACLEKALCNGEVVCRWKCQHSVFINLKLVV